MMDSYREDRKPDSTSKLAKKGVAKKIKVTFENLFSYGAFQYYISITVMSKMGEVER